ncbi:MAG: FkbM family methyltransferase [Clostridia bacterium]|nr:FkbM family methyltransferase [Clostridia bacterium]
MINYKNHIFNELKCDLWTHLKSTNKPILIYGMGNGADKIIGYFEKFGIEYKDVFASDGFVRGHLYRGKRVISYSEACEKYGKDIIIILSFGSRLPDVMNIMYELDKQHEFYAPDVPVCQGELFTEDFFDLHLSDLYRVREMMADEKSKLIFDNIIRYKLTGKLKYLKATEDTEENVNKELLKCENYKSYADLGAYNGDTVRSYLNCCPNLEKIYAFEPDVRNFKKLSAYAEAESRATVLPFNYASFDKNDIVEFISSGNRNSSKDGTNSHKSKVISIEARRLDSIVDAVDFIKYDVEGTEYEAIIGSEKIIKASQPDLLISLYHRNEDMYLLPSLVKSIHPEYKLYLRRFPYIPAWDLNLYAIK